MAYTDFLSRLRIAAGILLPLNTRTLLLYPGGRDCIGAAGVDAYNLTRSFCCLRVMSSYLLDLGNADAHCPLRRVSYDPPAPVSYAARFDAHCPNMTVTERCETFRYAYLLAVASLDACLPRPFGRGRFL